MKNRKDLYDVSDDELAFIAAQENVSEKIKNGREILNGNHENFNNSQLLFQQQQAMLAAMMHHRNN